jgi:hypothetical protein
MIPFALISNTTAVSGATSGPASGMTIWHKADAATSSNDESNKNTMKSSGSTNYITRLFDFSGNGFHGVTSSQDTGLVYSATKSQNGNPGLVRTLTYKGLEMNYATSSSLHTTFAVVTTKTSNTQGSQFMPVLQQGGSWDDENVEFGLYRDTDTSKSVMSIAANGAYGVIYTKSGLTAGTTYMGKSVCKKLSTSYLDPGQFEVSVSGMATDGSFVDTNTDYSHYGSTTPFEPDHAFHEFIHYNRVLTASEMTQTEQYLKSKWGMTF